jgi:type VI secretion system protein VasG
MTSNLGSELMTELCMQAPPPKREEVVRAIRPMLVKHFKAALLARMTVIPYFPLSARAMREIVDLKLGQLVLRLRETHKIELQVAERVSQQIVERCAEVETGARNVDHILSRTLLPLLSRALLARMSEAPGPRAPEGAAGRRAPLPKAMSLDLAEDGEYALSFEA